MAVILLALTIAWDCVTTDVNGGPEQIDHYCVFWSPIPHDEANSNMVCAQFAGCYWTLADDNFLYNTPYYFSVSAIDLAGNESALSDEVSWIREQPPFGGGSSGPRKRPQRFIYLRK